MFRNVCFFALVAGAACSPAGADNPRFIEGEPSIRAFRTLQQNWSDKESNWFYNVPQGSRLIPYKWFLHLELADSTDPVRGAKNILSIGYLPRTADPDNPDGLPVGFIRDAAYEDGTPGMGLTCAACHTSQIQRKGVAFVIDGGPGMGDFERLMRQIAAGLQATADDDAKFDRFAGKVLDAGAPAAEKAALRAKVRMIAHERAAYNTRNLPASDSRRFGHGRVDAFGAIFNEVSSTFLGAPDNVRPADAPVSYPCLWDAPQHQRVQWNGAAENKTNDILGPALFRTREIGALGRNSGEVLGVFGDAQVPVAELLPRRYGSTVNRVNLMAIENSLKTLWSPQWPEDEFGAIDPQLKAKGAAVFAQHCVSCHANIDRTSPTRHVAFVGVDVGTDPTLNRNFVRTAKTGRLRWRQKTLLGLDLFGKEDSVAAILKHVVERVILDPDIDLKALKFEIAKAAANPKEALDGLNPGFQVTATIRLGDQELVGRLDSLVGSGSRITVSGGKFKLAATGADVDMRIRAGLKDAENRLKGLVQEVKPAPADALETPRAELTGATVRLAYKARPLNGVWATAPYLHNGSVPTLAELLKPAAQRIGKFHVGGREFDPVNVGFVDDPSYPVFDVSAEGNSNAGHEYGSQLSEDEKRQLLEYLKSL